MSARASFSVTTALSAAFNSLPAAWSGAWLILLVLWAVGTGGPLVVMHHYHALWVAGGLAGLGLVVKLMVMGALYRIALFGKAAAKEGLGFGGLQLGWPELRLVLAQIVAMLFFFVIIAAILIVLAMGLNVSSAAGGDLMLALCTAFKRHQATGDWALIAYVTASLLLLAFVAVKFSLLHAANIAERRLVTLNALGLSSGHVGKLFGGMVILVLPFVLVWILIVHQFAPQIHLAHAMPYPWMGQQLHLLLYGGLMLLHIGALLPLLVGFFASAYRQIVASRAK